MKAGRRLRPGIAAIHLFLASTGLFLALPIVYLFNHAFKPLNELYLYPPTFFVRQPTLRNFEMLFFNLSTNLVPFSRYFFNSVAITAAVGFLVLLVSAMAAFILSKFRFHLKGFIMAMIMLSLMFAAETVGIPRYLIISGLGLTDTYLAYVLPFLASPVIVFLLKQFMDQVPAELLEAAVIDGAPITAVFSRIMVPLVAPAIATSAILTFQAVWGDVSVSALYVHDESMKTLAYYVSTLSLAAIGQGTSAVQNIAGQGMLAAGGLLLFVPNLIMFLFFQRYVIETMVNSGIK